MKNNFKFTKISLDKLPIPEKGRNVYHDTQITTLKLRVTKAGTKTFSVFRRVGGKPERFTLGKYPVMTVEQARKEAEKINGLIASGVNPNDKKREGRAELTLKELFDEFIEAHAKPHKKSWKHDVMNYKNHLSHWDNKKLSSISKKDVRNLHKRIGETKKVTANRVIRLLKTIFNKAIEWDYFDNVNPVIGVKQFKEKSRERFLQEDEIEKFFEALSNETNDKMRDSFYMAILTGSRISKVISMQWDHISFERKEWSIPDLKTSDSQTLPLIEEAIHVLKNRKDIDDSKFVFSGDGETGHLTYPKSGWKRVKKDCEIDDINIHDLRRSMGSWQTLTGASLQIVGKTLDHKNIATTLIYARLNTNPVRESMQKAARAMFDAGKEKAEVVPIKRQNK